MRMKMVRDDRTLREVANEFLALKKAQKVRDEGNAQPVEIKDIQTLLKALDKHNYTEPRDDNIVLCIPGWHSGRYFLFTLLLQ